MKVICLKNIIKLTCRSSMCAVLFFFWENSVCCKTKSKNLPVEIPFYNYPYKLKTTSNTMSVLQQKLSNNFPLMKSAMTSPRRSNSPKNNLRLKKDNESVEETKREGKSCRGMWQVPKNHIEWLVMSVFLLDCGNTHLEEATIRAVWRDRGPKSHILLKHSTPQPLREVVTLRICFSLAELPLILAVLTP